MGTTLRARRPPCLRAPVRRASSGSRVRGQNLMLLIIPATLVVRSEMVGAMDELAM